MSTSSTFTKDPDDILDYEIDWTGWLDGDTIVTSTWILPGTIVKQSDTHTTTTTTIWVSGGTVATRDQATNRITTAGGRTADRTLYFNITER